MKDEWHRRRTVRTTKLTPKVTQVDEWLNVPSSEGTCETSSEYARLLCSVAVQAVIGAVSKDPVNAHRIAKHNQRWEAYIYSTLLLVLEERRDGRHLCAGCASVIVSTFVRQAKPVLDELRQQIVASKPDTNGDDDNGSN